jgi:hypothetical protein
VIAKILGCAESIGSGPVLDTGEINHNFVICDAILIHGSANGSRQGLSFNVGRYT